MKQNPEGENESLLFLILTFNGFFLTAITLFKTDVLFLLACHKPDSKVVDGKNGQEKIDDQTFTDAPKEDPAGNKEHPAPDLLRRKSIKSDDKGQEKGQICNGNVR